MTASVYRHHELAIKEISDVANVPDCITAKLMFYLRCMYDLMDFSGEDENIERLIDFGNHDLLTEDEKDSLTIICLTISPDVINNKIIFLNNEMCGTSQNKFYELEAVRHRMMVSETLTVGDRVQQVHRVMFYKTSWLVEHYIVPMQQLTARLGARVAMTQELEQRGSSENIKHVQTSTCCVIS